MIEYSKIRKINEVVKEFFNKNPEIKKISAKELMDNFISAEVFNYNNSDGLPLRDLLRELDRNNELDRIPCLYAERKSKNTYWYFVKR